MKRVCVWLNEEQFKSFKQKADRLGKSHYAYAKKVILESLA